MHRAKKILQFNRLQDFCFFFILTLWTWRESNDNLFNTVMQQVNMALKAQSYTKSNEAKLHD